MFSKFHCKNNKLPVNKNRFDRNIVDRNCHLCDLHDLGDEFHYILVCIFFSQERKQFLDPYFYKNPNTLKMYELFNTDTLMLANLCKFITIITSKIQ